MKSDAIKSITIEYDNGEKETFTRKEDQLSLDSFHKQALYSSSWNYGHQLLTHIVSVATFSWLDLDKSEKV
jgi:hypothetical protein